MSNFKISFRDPQSGRQIEMEAEQQKAARNRRSVEESFEKATVEKDGKVDMMVEDRVWRMTHNRHLGINTEGASTEDLASLKRALEDPMSANLRVFDLQSGRDLSGLRVIKTDAAGELAAISPNLDTTGSRREVRITPTGHIATPDGQEPQNFKEIGDGLFRSACLIDDVKENLFDKIKATAPLKEKMFEHLVEAMEVTAPGQAPPEGMDETQALQMRSSAATNMLELMTSKHNISNDLKTRIFDQYEAAIKRETNPLLKDSMVFNLNLLQNTLPSALRERVDGVMNVIAPTHPPYDQWFANGKDTVNIAFSAGSESYGDGINILKNKGFTVTSEEHGKTSLEKTIERNGIETKFKIDMRHYSNDMFADMNDPNVDIQMYSGHSSWGRNVRNSLERAPQSDGSGKLILTDLCVGKGEIQMTRDKYPNAHLITTHNSSYFRPGGDSEGIHALLNVVDGISERKGYAEIAENTRITNPWRRTHERDGVDNNYIFPTDLETRRRVLDLDHDGQSDIFDRMVNFNTFDVKTDTTREFQAIEPARSANELVGTKVHFAAQTINRMTLYSQIFQSTNSTGEVVPSGYFAPKEGEKNLFRFEKTKVNGENTVSMQMNANYAHMSEEALRMAASYEYGLFKAQIGDISLNDRDAKLNAMIFASHSLHTDAGYRDREVWGEFIKAYNLPNVNRNDVEKAKEVNDHYYSGSHASLPDLWNKLSPEIQEALLQPKSGIIQ